MSINQAKAATNYEPELFDPASVRVSLNPAEAAEYARQAAFEKGYNDGLEQARQEVMTAMEESNHRVRRTIASLREAIDMFDQREATALIDVEDAIIQAALEIAKAVVQHDLASVNDPGAEALARSLNLAPARVDVVAHLHPEDAATLNVESVPTGNRNLVIVADPTIEPGGCLLEAGNTSIDGQFSAIFNNIQAALGIADTPIEPEGFSSPLSRTTASEATIS